MLPQTLGHLFPGINFQDECILQDEGAGPYIKAWRRAEKQPTLEELRAAEPAALAAAQAKEAQKVESDTARSEAKQAYSGLQPLIEHKDPAIALLASIMQKHLLATLGR
jgi:hypothetical protein